MSNITLRPKMPEERMLKNIVMELSDVKTDNDKLWWLKTYYKWAEDNEQYVCEKRTMQGSTQTYFVHNDLRKAYVYLKRALPNLFSYIEYPGIPKTTNALKAFFGHLKNQLRIYRGLTENRVDNFIKWYLFFNDQKKNKG